MVQGGFERSEHVIGCENVSGLTMRRCSWPRAGMEMRGPGPNHYSELEALCLRLVVPIPILLITRPYCSSTSCTAPGS